MRLPERTIHRAARAGRARRPWKNAAMTGEDTQPGGQPFDGRYRVLGRLGVGGMATVYLAEDSSLGRKVALKVMAERYAEDGEFVERFRREAQAAARLNHPNIIAVYDRGEADGRPYIAMEYLQGRTLKQVIQKEGPLSPERAIAIAMQVLAGLRYAHEHGVVHRDVKPHNVLVGDDGRIKVTDFGIAHAGDPADDRGRLDRRHRAVPLARAGARDAASGRRPTSTRSASCSTRCSRAACRSRATRRSRSRCSTSPTSRRRCARSRRSCPSRSAMVVGHAMLKDPSQRYAQRGRVRGRPRPRPSRPRAGRGDRADRDPARADRAGARRRGDAHRAASRGGAAPERREAPAAAGAAQALALAVAARPAAPAGRGRARGVRARRRLGERQAEYDDDDRPGHDRPTPPVTTRKLEDLEGKSFSEAKAALARLWPQAARHAPARARRPARGRGRGHERAPRGRAAAQGRHRAAQGLARPEGDPERRRRDGGGRARPARRRLQGQAGDGGQRRARQGQDHPHRSRGRPDDAGGLSGDDLGLDRAGPGAGPEHQGQDRGRGACDAGIGRACSCTSRRARAARTTYEVGQVAKQLPEVGTLVQGQTAVRFDLTNSPCTVDVPNVRDLPAGSGGAAAGGQVASPRGTSSSRTRR